VRRERESADLLRLLQEVDAALSRLDGDNYGVCRACHGNVEPSDLMANPMATYCLCELSPERQRALERDLDLAWRVQAALLPPLGLAVPGWESYYRYVPQGPVSGDYCDLVTAGDGGFYFMVGDVSGKGVAASLLMAHLNAALRAFARTGLPPQAVLDKANNLLAESTLTSHYATLVCGRATESGEVEIANGGHCPPVLVRSDGSVKALNTGGLPLGLAITGDVSRYAAEQLKIDKGDCLVLSTDGLTEAANTNDEEYSSTRLMRILARCPDRSPRNLVTNCLEDLSSFVGGDPLRDDLTILALSRIG
jgi:sigma-B regulation protein RsbU (phosphoserine phosphatase)